MRMKLVLLVSGLATLLGMSGCVYYYHTYWSWWTSTPPRGAAGGPVLSPKLEHAALGIKTSLAIASLSLILFVISAGLLYMGARRSSLHKYVDE
jgi:hypothetical protein